MFDFDSLEFNKFKEFLKVSFSSKFASDAIDDIIPLQDNINIIRVQNEINESIEISKNNKLIENDEEFYNLYPKLRNESFSLEPLEFILLRNFLIKIKKLKSILLEKHIKYLKNKAENLNCLIDFSNEISRCIDDKGEIKDDATSELKYVRKGLYEFKNRIKSQLNSILNSSNSDKFIQDKVIVERSGRYTIPCKSNFNQYIQGIIHDKSSSGQTLYIEPTSCVSINNEVQELHIKETEEIAKIIYNLMNTLKYSIDEIDGLVENYKYLSLSLEIGNFYKDKVFTFAELGGNILFTQVHHPIIYLHKKEQSIAIDFETNENTKTIIITGPNTGGKTAALKSIGLNHIITYCGLPIFGNYAKVKLYSSILADIGDNQSIMMDLSTFSAHMINIKNIINSANKDTLILFDELGTGTEPREGASLAVSILKYLESISSTSVITTHFSEVKNFALNNTSSLFYSVDFDYDTFLPKYRLIKDVIGKSDPILIAKKLGFKEEIIKNAENELYQYKTSIEMSVEELNRLTAEAKRFQRILDDKEKELKDKEISLNNSETLLQKKLSSKELELLEEAYSLLQKGKRLASEKMKVNSTEIEEDIKKTVEKIDKLKSERKTVSNIVVGDLLFLERYSKTAKVLSVEGDNIHLNMEGMRVKIKKSDAVGKKIDKNINQQIKVTSKASGSSVKRELLLVGKRVEEAIDILDKFIDESLLANYDKVYVIHGRGSGQLRKAIHEELRKDRRVKSYSLAENSDGGNAVTIINF